MRAFIGIRGFTSAVVVDNSLGAEVVAEGLTATRALLFAASGDLQGAVRGFLEAKTAGEAHRAMVAMRAALAKSEGKTELSEY